jgi:hypothetical protein
MTDFINRWRNLSIKCDRTLTEYEAVNLIMENIDGVDGRVTWHDKGQHVQIGVQHGKNITAHCAKFYE